MDNECLGSRGARVHYHQAMASRRREKVEVQGRALLERALDLLESEGWEALVPERLAQLSGLPLRSMGRAAEPEDLFFPEHAELLDTLQAMLEKLGLAETCMAMARFQEDERDHWLRRLRVIEAEPRLRLRRGDLDREIQACLAAHFRRWGTAGPQGERSAELEAAFVITALRGAERLWVQGKGRPTLPVLVQEALALLWPALYPHVRRNR